MEKALKNSHYLFIAVLIMIFVGFYRTYFGLFPHFTGLTNLLHIHAFLILIWMSILIAQPILIRAGQLEWHRQVGRLSYVVVPLMVLTIMLVMRSVFMRSVVVNPGSLDTNMIGVADLTFFGLTYGSAIYYRHKVSYHARYMVLTVLPFINPALGRLNLPGPVLGIVILLGLLIYERFNNRIYRPYALALPAYLVIYISFLFFITTADWKAFWWMFF